VLETEPITDANVGQATEGPAISEEEHEIQLTAEEAVDAADAMIATNEFERQWTNMGEPLVHAAMAHSAAGHLERARAYGRRAVQAAFMEDGYFHPDNDPVKELADDPRTHWTWKMRVKDDVKSCGCQK